MNSILKWFSDYGWLLFILLTFFIGIFFIFWMGNTETKEYGITKIEEIEEYMLNKKEDNISDNNVLANNPSPEIQTTPVEYNSTLEEENIEIEPVSSPLSETGEELKHETDDLCPTLLIKRGDQVMLFNKNVPEMPGENPIFFDNLEQYKEYVKKQRELYDQNCPVLFLQEEVNAQGENIYKMRNVEGIDNVDPIMFGSIQDYFLSKTDVMPKFGPPQGPSAFNNPTTNTGISLANYSVPYKNLPMQFKTEQPLVPYSDANRDNKPYNQGYYGFDPTSQYVGRFTVLDQIHNSTMMQNADGLSNNPMDPNWGGAVFTANKVEEGIYEGNSVQPPTVPTVLQS